MEHPNLEQKLNDILTRNYEAEKGFAYVIETIEHRGLSNLMDKSISERLRFGQEVKSIMKTLGFTPNEDAEVQEFRHRAWTHFKEIFSTNNDSAMFDEAIRGESDAIEYYETALKEIKLPKEHADVLREHLMSIRQTKNDLEVLKRNVALTA